MDRALYRVLREETQFLRRCREGLDEREILMQRSRLRDGLVGRTGCGEARRRGVWAHDHAVDAMDGRYTGGRTPSCIRAIISSMVTAMSGNARRNPAKESFMP